MENINEEKLNLITKHLRKETSSSEESLLKEWLNESTHNKSAYNEVVYIWSAGKISHVPDVDAAWNKVKAKAHINGKTRSLFEAKSYMKLAASLVLIVGIGYLMKTIWFDKETLTYISSGNEKKEIYLPDSSKVWLNKNTNLSYSDNYNESDRVIHLEGEAFFEVQKNKEKPFIVIALLSRTEVLGTSFNVRSLKNETLDKVEVVTGKVSFSSQKNEDKVFLLPGDEAVLKNGEKIEKSKTVNDNSLSWKSDKLIFDNTTLQGVVLALENYFNVPIIIQDPKLYGCRFTGTFNKPEIEEVMKVLSVSINLSFDKKDTAYLVTGIGCE